MTDRVRASLDRIPEGHFADDDEDLIEESPDELMPIGPRAAHRVPKGTPPVPDRQEAPQQPPPAPPWPWCFSHSYPPAPPAPRRPCFYGEAFSGVLPASQDCAPPGPSRVQEMCLPLPPPAGNRGVEAFGLDPAEYEPSGHFRDITVRQAAPGMAEMERRIRERHLEALDAADTGPAPGPRDTTGPSGVQEGEE